MEKSNSIILDLNFSMYYNRYNDPFSSIPGEKKSWDCIVAVTGDLGAAAGPGPSYHAELGLQFNLQALEHEDHKARDILRGSVCRVNE